MATDENVTQTEGQQTIKTAADIRIDQLEARISQMEDAHKKQVEELLEANRGLYAMLQSKPAEAAAAPQPEQAPEQVPGPDPAVAAMNKALGIKEV